MKKLGCLIFILGSILLLTSCTQKDSLFSKPIQNKPGSLKIQETSGFIGAVTIGTSLDFELHLFSFGGLDVKDINPSLVTTDPIEFKGGTYPGTGGDCGSELSSGNRCTIVLTYSPTTIASHLATLHFSYSDAVSSYQHNFTVSADSHPILTFEYGSQYDFGNKFLGTSTDLKIKISNTGRVNAEDININNLSAPFSFKGGSYPGVGGTCGSRIVTGQSCEMVINYTPTTNGQHLQDITLNYLNAGRPEENTLNLLAWGFEEAQLAISSSTGNDFGTVPNNNVNTKTFVVSHVNGDVSANLINLRNLTAPFFRAGGTCTTVLTIDQGSCTIIVGLNSSSSASWSNTFSLDYHTGISLVSINKTVTAITKERPSVSFAPSAVVDFQTVKVNSTRSITFTATYDSGEIPATELALTGLSAPFSRTGGTCLTTLSSGSCTIIVSFSPTTNAQWTQPIVLSFNNSIATVSTSGVSVTGKSEAKIYAPSATINFGNVVSGQTKNLSPRIVFFGGAPATDITVTSISVPYQFTSGSFPGSTSNPLRCTTTLSASSCDLYLTFAPLKADSYNGITLVVTYNNGVDQSTFSFTLNGVGSPAAQITAENKSYSSTPVNSAVAGPSLVRLTNSSSMPASAVEVVLPVGFSYRGGTYPGTSGSCNSTVLGNSWCSLDIIFSPLSAISYSGTLTVNYNDGTTSRTATSTLTGTGTISSDLYWSNFDSVTYIQTYVGKTPYETKVIKLGHGGSANAVTINSKSISSPDFSILSDNCPSSLNNGATCSLSVAFAPQSAGSKSTSLQVNYDSLGITKTGSRSLSGNAVTPAVISALPSPLSFGALPTNAVYDLEFTLTKSGSFNSQGTIGTITGAGFTFKGGVYPGTGGTCLTSGSFPATCKVVISFSPVSLISYNGIFSLNYGNGHQTVSVTNPLSGSGFPTAKLAFSSASYSFGQVIQTTLSERTISLTNTGSALASGLSFSNLSLPYRYKGGAFPGTGGSCGTDLMAGANCQLVVEFAPTSTGLSNQNMIVTYNNSYSSVQSTASLTGEGLAQAIISISEISPYNFGTTNIGGTIEKSFVLTNAGSVSGTNLTGAFSSVFTFLGGAFPGTSGTCLSTLPAGSSCLIVLSFSPSAATNYSGSLTLNYHDGLRLQSELKELRGTGSAKLYDLNYFSKLSQKSLSLNEFNQFNQTLKKTSEVRLSDINSNGFSDKLESYFSSRPGARLILKSLDGLDQKLIYKQHHFLPTNYHQGISVIKLSEDVNQDGVSDLLLGIYKQEGHELKLVGYDVICGRTGNILIRNLSR